MSIKNQMANSVDPDEMAHYRLSHLDLHCLRRYHLVCRNERVGQDLKEHAYKPVHRGCFSILCVMPHTFIMKLGIYA